MLNTPDESTPELQAAYIIGLKEVLLRLLLGSSQYTIFLQKQGYPREYEERLTTTQEFVKLILDSRVLVSDPLLNDSHPETSFMDLMEMLYNNTNSKMITQDQLHDLKSYIVTLGQILLDSLDPTRNNQDQDKDQEESPDAHMQRLIDDISTSHEDPCSGDKLPKKDPELYIKLDFCRYIIKVPKIKDSDRTIQIECVDFEELQNVLRSLHIGYEYGNDVHIAALNNVQESHKEDGFFKPSI